MDMILMTILALNLKEIFAMSIFLGFWFFVAYILINAYFSSRPRKGTSPPVLDSRGHFIRKPDENQDLADWAQ